MDIIERRKFNISLLGDTCVGKTNIIFCYHGQPFNEGGWATIGIDDFIEEFRFEGIDYKFKIYNTAGADRYDSVSSSTIPLSDGFLLIFSFDYRRSFEKLHQWMRTIKDKCDISKKVIFLIGNKIDLAERKVTNEEAIAFAKLYKIDFNYET